MTRLLQVLGPGCPRCQKLADNAEAAAKALGIEYRIEKVTDIAQIIAFGVLAMPALAVDGQVKSAGKLLSPDEIKKLIE